MRVFENAYFLGLAQLAALIASLPFFQKVWPAQHMGMGALVDHSTPFFAWLPPFAVYAIWPIRKKVVGRFFLATFLLLVGYQISLELLDRWQKNRAREAFELCMSKHSYPCGLFEMIDYRPPTYWEWSAAAYFACVLSLYALVGLRHHRDMRACS